MKYISPTIGKRAFTCTHCNTYSQQFWSYFLIGLHSEITAISESVINNDCGLKERYLCISTCAVCQKYHIWKGDEIIYPEQSGIPLANKDMPDRVKEIYYEASSVYPKSGKAAAALLRLALQYLCIDLGEKGKNINEDIKELVKKGLDVKIQKALDIIRVTGNNAVHPGMMNLEDDKNIAYKLFELINFIVNQMITQPKEISSLFEELPETAKEGIEKRNKQILEL